MDPCGNKQRVHIEHLSGNGTEIYWRTFGWPSILSSTKGHWGKKLDAGFLLDLGCQFRTFLHQFVFQRSQHRGQVRRDWHLATVILKVLRTSQPPIMLSEFHKPHNDTSVRSLHWRHNDHDSVSNHQPHDCLPNRLFRRRSKKTSMLRVTGLCAGNSPGPVNSLHKGPVTRKMFPFDDVIMCGDRRWQAANTVSLSSLTFRTVWTKSLQIPRVTSSSSLATHLMPWMTKFHRTHYDVIVM